MMVRRYKLPMTILVRTVIVLSLLTGCSNNPVQHNQAIIDWSTKSIQYVAEQEIAGTLSRTGGTALWLQGLANSVLPKEASPSIYIAYEPWPNAYAFDHGVIVVSSGLIALAESDDIIAAVIAHEYAHIAYQDSNANLRRSRSNQLAGGWFLGIGQAIATDASNAYARKLETRADSSASEAMHSTGRSNMGLYALLQLLKHTQETKNSGARHPSFEHRLAAAEPTTRQPLAPMSLSISQRSALVDRTVTFAIKKQQFASALALLDYFEEAEPAYLSGYTRARLLVGMSHLVREANRQLKTHKKYKPVRGEKEKVRTLWLNQALELLDDPQIKSKHPVDVPMLRAELLLRLNRTSQAKSALTELSNKVLTERQRRQFKRLVQQGNR